MSRGQQAVQSSAWRRRVQGLACARQSKAGEELARAFFLKFSKKYFPPEPKMRKLARQQKALQVTTIHTPQCHAQMTSVLFAASCVHMSLAHIVSAFQPAWYGERTHEFLPSRELCFRHARHVNPAARAMTCISAQHDARWRGGFLQQDRCIKKGLCAR